MPIMRAVARIAAVIRESVHSLRIADISNLRVDCGGLRQAVCRRVLRRVLRPLEHARETWI